MEAYIATDRGEKRGKGDLDESERHLVKADFRYDEERDGFHCPGGQMLRLKTALRTGHRVYQGDIEACRTCVYYRLLPVEVGGGAHDHERREGAVARADVVRAAQTTWSRCSGRSRTRDSGDSGCGGRRRWRGSSRLRGAQPQENHFCGTSGRGVSGVREASGLGVKKGRIREKEVKNRPLSALFAKIEQKSDFNGFEDRHSMVFHANDHAHERCHGQKSPISNSRTAS